MKHTMTDDQINKVETILGYLEYLLKLKPDSQIQSVAEEASEWLAEERADLQTAEMERDAWADKMEAEDIKEKEELVNKLRTKSK